MASAAGKRVSRLHRFAPGVLSLAITAALAGAATGVDAAGLGRLTVFSSLGQPLQAEVEVTSLARDDVSTLSARLAPPDYFRQAGVEFNPALNALRFAIDRRPDGKVFVKITSVRPVSEPFIDLLVELNWASGRFIREYTFLLDPPELRNGKGTVEGNALLSQTTPAAAAPVRPAAAPAPAPAPARPAPPEPAAQTPAPAGRAAAPDPARPPLPADTGRAVMVQPGDTLTDIANRVKPADIPVEQAMVAIYQANPQAFFGSLHQMYAGRRLAIPDRAAMESIDPAEARREIRIQAADFNAYRQRLAAAPRRVESGAAGQGAAGKVSARVAEPAAGAPSGDRLVLSRPAEPAQGASGSSAAGAGAAQAPGSATGSSTGQSATESSVANAAALREQQERLSLLEKNLGDLQRLLELKNKQLAELQSRLESAQRGAPSAAGAVGQPPAAGVTPAATPSAPSPAAPPPATPPTAAQPAPVPAATPAPPPAPAPAASAAPAASPAAPAPAPAPAATTDAPRPAPAKPPAVQPPASSSPLAFLDDLLDNPLTVPSLAAVLVLLGLYGWYTVRKRRRAERFEDSLIATDAFTANSLFGTTGGQAVDTSRPDLFGPSLRDTGVDVHSTEVDPIAEAEVYIAYGREAQAEEILREALRKQPERQAVRVKLLELYATRKDSAAFAVLATELLEGAGSGSEEWPKVAALGRSIDPTNPLYADAASAASGAQSAATDGADRASANEAVALAEPISVIEEPVGSRASLPGPAAAEDVPPLDFSISIDTAIGRPVDEVVAPRFDEGLDLQSEGEIPLAGAPEPVRPADAASSSELERAIGGRFDLPSLDMTPPEPNRTDSPPARTPAEEPPTFADLGDFRIDLSALDALQERGGRGRESTPVPFDESPGGGSPNPGSPLFAQWQEMATKLDLAAAYEEIGDKDGARELLEEVMRNGDADQQSKAKSMLSQIG